MPINIIIFPDGKTYEGPKGDYWDDPIFKDINGWVSVNESAYYIKNNKCLALEVADPPGFFYCVLTGIYNRSPLWTKDEIEKIIKLKAFL